MLFAPIVKQARSMMGDKEFMKLRGQMIAKHTQTINAFCKRFGIATKQAQDLIRLAKKNGERLGFLV